MSVTNECGSIIVCKYIHIWCLNTTWFSYLLIWASALVFMLDNSYSFLWSFIPHHFNCEQKGDMKGPRQFFKKASDFVNQITQCITFFRLFYVSYITTSAIDWKELRNEIDFILYGIIWVKFTHSSPF